MKAADCKSVVDFLNVEKQFLTPLVKKQRWHQISNLMSDIYSK